MKLKQNEILITVPINNPLCYELLQDEKNNQTPLIRGSYLKIGGHRVSFTSPDVIEFLLYKP